ncbi:protein TPRXL [Pyrus ussuriensis x Pyrus communis]|uniref:Protein TPRXL n=1 Tax=Pyrus ussuriensis x Pyrus communis TaxID=2448454 RepID=A0A5N5I3N5_9ROSA|nr:protein TPRXL [Pyrus ussuriensis x Pyrus communis]
MGGDSLRFPGWGSTHSGGNSSGSPFYSQSFLEHERRNNNASAPNLCRCGENGLFTCACISSFVPYIKPQFEFLNFLFPRKFMPIYNYRAGFWMFVPFSSTCIPAFASASTPAFGATGFAPFTRTTSPMFGSRGDGSYGGSFGASNTPAFGSSSSTVGTSSNQAFGASSTIGFGSFSSTQPLSSSPTSAFNQSSFRFSSSPFGASSPFGSQCFPFVSQSTTIGNTGQSAFGGQQRKGSSVASYTATPAVDDTESFQSCTITSSTIFKQPNCFWSSSAASSTSNPIAFGQATPLFVSSQPLQSSGSVFNIVSQTPQGNTAGSTAILGQNGFESFSSIPAFGQLSYMSGCCQLCASCGAQSTTGNTALGKPVSECRPDEKFHSISSMPIYGDRTHEEMRWQNYQLGDKGGPALGGVTHFTLLTKKPAPTFAQTSLSLNCALLFGTSSHPNFDASSGPRFDQPFINSCVINCW